MSRRRHILALAGRRLLTILGGGCVMRKCTNCNEHALADTVLTCPACNNPTTETGSGASALLGLLALGALGYFAVRTARSASGAGATIDVRAGDSVAAGDRAIRAANAISDAQV